MVKRYDPSKKEKNVFTKMLSMLTQKQYIKCQVCGKPIPIDASFCRFCNTVNIKSYIKY